MKVSLAKAGATFIFFLLQTTAFVPALLRQWRALNRRTFPTIP
jgi:hypothetical protein